MRLWACVALTAMTLLGCDLPGEQLGVDDATRITFEAEVPVSVRLPPADLPAADRDFSFAFTIPVPMDLVQTLNDLGRPNDAKILQEKRDKIEAVVLDEVEYEVVAPNLLPAQVEPVTVYFAPLGSLIVDANARELGRTVAIEPREAIATRELDYSSMGLADASDLLGELAFSILFDVSVRIPRAQPIPAEALVAKMRLKITVRIDLAG